MLTKLFTTILLLTACHVYGLIGCVDPLAVNFNPSATEDSGNCVYETECADGEEFYVFTFGYGVEGFTAYLTGLDMQDTLLSVEGFMAFQQAGACLHPDSCYIWHSQVGEGGSYYQAPWIVITDAGMSTIDAMGNVHGFEFRNYFSPSGTYCGNAGCMDENAMNYKSTADIDYGCVYCQDNKIRLRRDSMFSNASNVVGYRNSEGETASAIYYQTISTYESRVCFADDCYELQIRPQSGNSGATFNQYYLEDEDGQLIWQGWRSHADTVRVPFGLNATDCEDNEHIYGCTNPLAVNYNPEATRYDGSCDLFNGLCSFTFEFVPDSTAENTVHIISNIQTSTYPFYTLWDFGDAPTIDSHHINVTMITDEPVNVCVRFYAFNWQYLSFPHCMDSFCLEFDPEAYGFSPGDQLQFLTPDSDTGLDEMPSNVRVNCFPNPARDILHVSVTGHTDNLNRTVFTDLHGRQVLSQTIPAGVGESAFQVDVSQLARGMYILSVFSDTGRFNQRVVVE